MISPGVAKMAIWATRVRLVSEIRRPRSLEYPYVRMRYYTAGHQSMIRAPGLGDCRFLLLFYGILHMYFVTVNHNVIMKAKCFFDRVSKERHDSGDR